MIYLFNTNVCPGEAIVRIEKISASEAAKLAKSHPFTSAIGHESTAAAMSEILGVEVQVNRINADPEPGDRAISLKLNGRLPEGQILDRAALEEIGYTLYLMSFYETELGIAPHYCIDSLIVY